MTPRETCDSHLSPISNRYFPPGLPRSPTRASSTVTYLLSPLFPIYLSPFPSHLFVSRFLIAFVEILWVYFDNVINADGGTGKHLFQ